MVTAMAMRIEPAIMLGFFVACRVVRVVILGVDRPILRVVQTNQVRGICR